MKRLLLLITTLSILFPSVLLAHPGRTDSSGCHTCRTNCAKWGLAEGEYHCHRAKTLPQPKEPVKSKFSETGGVTVPAPEYKKPMPATAPKPKPAIETKAKVEVPKVEPVVEIEKVETTSVVEQQNKEGWIKRLFKFLFN